MIVRMRQADQTGDCSLRQSSTFTRTEGEHLAQMLQTQPWLAGAALEAQLKTQRSPRILHLATHGFFLEDQQYDPEKVQRMRFMGSDLSRLAGSALETPLLRSGLALAGANTWLQGGCFCLTLRKGKTNPSPCFVRCARSYRKRKSRHGLVRNRSVSVMRHWACTKVSLMGFGHGGSLRTPLSDRMDSTSMSAYLTFSRGWVEIAIMRICITSTHLARRRRLA